MIRGLVFVGLAYGALSPAMAGERGAATPAPRAVPTFSIAAVDPSPALGTAAPLRMPVAAPLPATAPVVYFTVTLHSMPIAPPTPLAEFEALPFPQPQIGASPVQIIDGVTLGSPFAVRELHALAAWRIMDAAPAVTATANGTYAVRDQLADFRKPRAYRPTMLSAMLKLKIDGNEDTEPFSVGGGAVAAALWKVMPQ